MNPETTVTGFGIQPGMKIADFGAGTGFFTILMAKLVGETGQVTALDVLEPALESIRTQAKAEGLANIQTVRSNLEVVGSSNLAEGSQDLVLVKNMLFQSPNKAEIISEARRVLRPEGRLIVIDWKKGAGGLGPPDDLRSDESAISALVAGAGLTAVSSFPPDAFHFGLIFKKN